MNKTAENIKMFLHRHIHALNGIMMRKIRSQYIGPEKAWQLICCLKSAHKACELAEDANEAEAMYAAICEQREIKRAVVFGSILRLCQPLNQ